MPDKILKKSVLLRMVLIGILAVCLLIPSALIIALVSERKHERDSAVSEVSDKWGNAQTILGPVLTIPYVVTSSPKKGDAVRTTCFLHVLPESLSMVVNLSPTVRYRGIYEAVLYSAHVRIDGNILLPDISRLGVAAQDVQWDKSYLTLGMSDLRGIRDTVTLRLGEQNLVAEPGVKSNDFAESGITFAPALNPSQTDWRFSTTIQLNGSGQMMFVPVGKTTEIRLSAPWGKPSFAGNRLPDSRTIENDAFTAEWKVLHLNRSFPQAWTGKQYDLSKSAFGVALLAPIDEYQKTMRSAKYAVMFIAFTFLALFLTEVLSGRILHPIQYALIGFAVLLFYVVLLSLSEQMAFKYAYLVSSFSIILLIAGYTKSILSGFAPAAMISGILAILYGFLYALLQLEDYVLLIGSIGLFVALALVMYLTRRIDWYDVNTRQAS
jgi:inner membrane protein